MVICTIIVASYVDHSFCACNLSHKQLFSVPFHLSMKEKVKKEKKIIERCNGGGYGAYKSHKDAKSSYGLLLMRGSQQMVPKQHLRSDSASPICPFCHSQETLLHVLRDCPRAATMWVHLVAANHQRGFFSYSLWDWMVTYLQQPWSSVNDSGDADKDGVLFAATVWLLWKHRKTWVYDGHGFSSERLIQHMGNLADDYGRVLSTVEHCDPTPAVRYLSWCFYWNQPPSQLQLRTVIDTSQVVFPKL